MDNDLGKDIKIAAMVWAATELTKLTAARLVTADFSQTFEDHFRRIVHVVTQEYTDKEQKEENAKRKT